MLSRQSFLIIELSSFHMSRDRVKSLPISGDEEFRGECTN